MQHVFRTLRCTWQMAVVIGRQRSVSRRKTPQRECRNRMQVPTDLARWAVVKCEDDHAVAIHSHSVLHGQSLEILRSIEVVLRRTNKKSVRTHARPIGNHRKLGHSSQAPNTVSESVARYAPTLQERDQRTFLRGVLTTSATPSASTVSAWTQKTKVGRHVSRMVTPGAADPLHSLRHFLSTAIVDDRRQLKRPRAKIQPL